MSITQDATRTVTAAAHAHAREDGLRITVAVVDTGGRRMGLHRMDGAPPLSAQIAEAKAQGAKPDEDRACAEAGLGALGG